MTPCTAFELMEKKKGVGMLSLGCPRLDHNIGGIPIQGITEV